MKFYSMVMTLIGVLISFSFSVGSKAVSPSHEEFDQTTAWAGTNFATTWPATKLPPFSFVYGGRASSEFLKGWKLRIEPGTSGGAEKKQVYLYADPATGLELRCEVTRYADSPAVEWVLYFKNTGSEPTPILEQVHALDVTFGGQGGPFVLHWALGSGQHGKPGEFTPGDFAPREQELGPNAQLTLRPVGGRSSNTTALPFFNLALPRVQGGEERPKGDRSGIESPGGGGTVIGLGWSGQWSASFAHEAEGVHIQAGMELTHLSLKPGESIRTPRVLLLFWKGPDRLRGQNLLRQFILVHVSPKLGGHLPTLPIAAISWLAFDEGNKVTEKNQIEFASTYKRMLPIDTFWLDAGWFEGGWPNGAGNWFVKKDAFPRGLRPLSDAVHNLGMRFVVWFEPERVYAGTWLDTHHPEWLLGEANGKPCVSKDALEVEPEFRAQWLEGKTKLLNLGNDAARQWAIDHFSQMIGQADIDIYRQDFNTGPLPYWRCNDVADRQGITEIRYVEGLYEFWDELLRQHPRLMIDNCASGGRRIDLETISRSNALWRSDWILVNRGGAGFQVQGVGLGLWVPPNSSAVPGPPDVYKTRSVMGAGLVLPWDVRQPEFDSALAKRLVKEEIRIQKYYYGDLYPLTAISDSETDWLAYQYDRPDLGEGMIMAFRHEKSPEKSWTVKLRGLKAKSSYELEDLDDGTKRFFTGKELAEGLALDIPAMPGSRLLIYKSKK